MKKGHVLMDSASIHRAVVRLSHEIGERNEGYHDLVLIGVRGGGYALAGRMRDYLLRTEGIEVPCAEMVVSSENGGTVSGDSGEIPFETAGKVVVLCDHIIHSGRTAFSAIEKIFRHGKPAKLQLLVLVDRGGRELPVRADYIGKNVPTSHAEHIEVCLTELGSERDELRIARTAE